MVISGLESAIYPVKPGDFYLATDTGNLYLGTESGNICIRQGNKKEWIGYVTIAGSEVTVENVGINTFGETPALASTGTGVLTITTTNVRFVSSPGLLFAVDANPVGEQYIVSVNNDTENVLVLTVTDDAGTEQDCSLFIHITIWE